MIFHDSRDARFRFPEGARPLGETVRLSVRADGAKSATLRLWKDGREWRVPMARVSADPTLFPEHGPRHVERAHAISPRPGEAVFTCEAALPEDTGSLWYYFILEYDDIDALRAAVNSSALANEDLRAHPVSPLYYGDARDHCYGAGEVYGCEPPSYQITVYDPAGEGPAWMREATMMQIMVDRFHRAGEKDQKNLAPWCYYHKDWYEWPDLNLELDAQEHSANDFFGGDLRGIEEKLPYIESLGVTVLYLNPIFRSPSNHKYDTGNYLQVDPSFGTEEDLRSLCAAAKKRGIRVILDGVFSHTGADSVYFNKYGTYGEQTGAYPRRKESLPRLVPLPPVAKGLRLLVGLYDAAQRQRNGQELPRLQSTARTAWPRTGSRPVPPAGGWTWRTNCPCPFCANCAVA